MKKSIGLLLFLTVHFSSVVFAAQGATVRHIQGEVMIIHTDGKSAAATENTALQKDDKVRTGPDGMADVTVNGLAGCRLLGASQLRVMDDNPQSTRLKVRKGNIILNVGKLPAGSTFQVETPTAVASVRGTQFWGRVDSPAELGKKEGDDKAVTTFAVREGTVEVTATASSQKFTLKEGQALDIPAGEAAKPSVRDALGDEMKAMEQAPSISI